MDILVFHPETYNDARGKKIFDMADKGTLIMLSRYVPRGQVTHFDLDSETFLNWLRSFDESIQALGE